MDLRRIVEDVEERRRDELALVGPTDPKPRPSSGPGAAGSLLLAVRERMLAEDPEADVAGIDNVLEPDRVEPFLPAPGAKRAGRKRHGHHAGRAKSHAPEPSAEADIFLDSYLEMSVVFEERFGIQGWADFVAKKTAHPAGPTAVAKPRTGTKAEAHTKLKSTSKRKPRAGTKPKSTSKRKPRAGTKPKSTSKRKPDPKTTHRRK